MPRDVNTDHPVGVDIQSAADEFDRARQRFLSALREFLLDPRTNPKVRDQEFHATISAMSQIMALVEVG